MSGCENCGAAVAKFSCSRCKTTYYCSKRCQKRDWPTHKIICKSSDNFPAMVLGLQITPPTEQCYFHLYGNVSDGWGALARNTFYVNERYLITAEQLLRFTESPSHACTFADKILLCDSSLATKVVLLAQSAEFKCYKYSEQSSCDRPFEELAVNADCLLMLPPSGEGARNVFSAQIMMNGCCCANPQCKQAMKDHLKRVSEKLRRSLVQAVNAR